MKKYRRRSGLRAEVGIYKACPARGNALLPEPGRPYQRVY